MVTDIPCRHVEWKACYRIILSRFPPIDLFERAADADDFDALYIIESLTNDRLRNEVGQIQLVPQEDRVFGPGASFIMAAFTHLPPEGSRFSDGTYGVFYAAHDLDTAIAETRYHRERFLARTSTPPTEIDMRVLRVDLDAELHDIRGMLSSLPDVYAPDDYSASKVLARSIRDDRSYGLDSLKFF